MPNQLFIFDFNLNLTAGLYLLATMLSKHTFLSHSTYCTLGRDEFLFLIYLFIYFSFEFCIFFSGLKSKSNYFVKLWCYQSTLVF